MKPGEVFLGCGAIALNAGRRAIEIEVENSSTHPVWVGSHYPFFEVNRRLVFDRAKAWGMHLDIPAGDAVGWRPNERKRVRLVEYGGARTIRGFHRLTEGPAAAGRLAEALRRARHAGFADRPERPIDPRPAADE